MVLRVGFLKLVQLGTKLGKLGGVVVHRRDLRPVFGGELLLGRDPERDIVEVRFPRMLPRGGFGGGLPLLHGGRELRSLGASFDGVADVLLEAFRLQPRLPRSGIGPVLPRPERGGGPVPRGLERIGRNLRLLGQRGDLRIARQCADVGFLRQFGEHGSLLGHRDFGVGWQLPDLRFLRQARNLGVSGSRRIRRGRERGVRYRLDAGGPREG
ncbi:hypothetical protein DMC63_22820, partial [Streptomyces sp. WAC 05977]